ncbi:MAG: hypothetical protein A3C43_07305 [Candidatus Schekmanbacteria bacterium RIFCSPHIGHO2_02_FULL_38_11]|uniref:Type 4 fimbrial biogenesis protein PilX N-terminal domain-containing protein n=1 Tax=Candidatus Schekmanbacteria bacterium RIFCSPLOWO2_12_FULL_38_15 TaxID=1817883 RepID=A0A1F7SK97_9BACT|nr:MAG: hypothetical protein A2043_08795 [Candidatus Schekmanbacteria bacterium GWA2_38_9]OGL51234.1 MAG: hypothetical protein A3H37_10495 [Candidatus Schekmanbacteria bacterium RIFCSPLOWO2_02_FULL_38_14]OGL53688.1 MAG: hypothetical protein A3C43_07305 [Candidatus Schekmanbacteria bacterium RIFCSPHIGHO2_02_FULL_38_11]OGL54185.1 MAG: hypothetical protein A3G31_05335 [Candidatus Schekmanbacteria bacterium RIFCSPLOWO2_12_FULL_38_15]
MSFKEQIIISNQGAALIASLVILIVLTLFATLAITINIVELKVSDNHEEANKAFYGAESGIQHALAQLKTTTMSWTNSNASFTSLLSGATSLNPWVSFLSSGNYVIKIKDDNDEAGTPDPAVDTNRRIYIRSESSTLFGAKKVIEVLVEGYMPEDVSVWNNAIFSGSGQAGKMVKGKVIISGSVHLLGENASGVQTVGYADTAVDLEILEMGGKARIGNNYDGLVSGLLDKIPDLATSPQSLNSVLRIKHGKVSLEGDSKIGSPEATTAYKDTMDGVYITDGYVNPNDVNQVFTDKSGVYNDTIPVSYQSQIKMPSLSDQISSGVSYENWLTTNSLHIPSLDIDFTNGAASTLSAKKSEIESKYSGTTVSANTSTGDFTITRTDSNGNQHLMSWTNSSKTLQVKGIVTVDGNLDIGNGTDGAIVTYITDPTTINGTTTVGSTIFANSDLTGGSGKVKVHNSVMPSGSKSFATSGGETLGFVAKDKIEIALKDSDSDLTVAAAFFAENEIVSAKKNDVAGTFVSNYINLGIKSPTLFQVPALANNLPPGLPGSTKTVIPQPPKIISWREVQ